MIAPKGSNYFAFRSEDESVFFLFMASRHLRKERMEELCILARALNNITNVRYIVGIATDNYTKKKGRSYDYILLDGMEKDEDEKLLKESKDLFGNLVPDQIYDFPKDKPKIIEY